MRFKIDENLPVELAEYLQTLDHDACKVIREGLQGREDAIIASACRSENRILITLDLDFSDLRVYPPDTLPGIIVLRLRRQSGQKIIEVMKKAFRILREETIQKRLVIIEDERIRIRGAR